MTIDVAPCEPWCDPADVADCAGVGTDTDQLIPYIAAASQLLYELSGEQFSGLCAPPPARPCNTSSPCAWWTTELPYSWGYWPLDWGWGWGWGYQGCASLGCGCAAISRVLLPGYPVDSITRVVIDGEVVDPNTYELRRNCWLVRLSTEDTQRFWPACQRMDLPLGEVGTWSVEYVSGYGPPELGVLAAQQLACELWKAMHGDECAIPPQTTQLTRQGLTVQRTPFIGWGFTKGQGWGTGMILVDAFLSAYNPAGLIRPSSVWSPDVQQYAEVSPPVGT